MDIVVAYFIALTGFFLFGIRVGIAIERMNPKKK